jgi:hypothetical protein
VVVVAAVEEVVMAVEDLVAVLHMGLGAGDDHVVETVHDELVHHSEKVLDMPSSAVLVLDLVGVEEVAVVRAEHHDARMGLVVVAEG